MGVTNIFIARHGETEYNRMNRIQGRGIDASLNETGRLQAQSIAGCLREEAIDCVFSSSLKRSQETAEIIASILHLKVFSYAELDEMNFGSIEGRPMDKIRKELNELDEKWRGGKVDFAMPDGESPAAVLKRVGKRMKLLLEEHHNTNILFILHGRLIRVLLSEWLNYGLDGMHRIEHCNGALYHLKLVNGIFNPVYLKQTKHLNGIEP